MNHIPEFSAESFRTIPFLKGHGTGNDFVVVPDIDGEISLTALDVASICDRHFGIGADGLLRVVRSTHMSAETLSDAKISSDESMYFMDYRNADGSIAETCGNGIRVFAHYLVTAGLVAEPNFSIGTRAGVKSITYLDSDRITVNMGRPQFESESDAVQVTTNTGSWNATAVSMPNPHCVSFVADQADPGALLTKPTFAPIGPFTNDANFEFITQVGAAHIRMRTYERGVGETLSCGSGATSAAAVFAKSRALESGWIVQVEVLGGTVWVSELESGDLTLTGPAQIIAEGEFHLLPSDKVATS